MNISIKYIGDLRTECKHQGSGEIIITDAPLDNHGKGEAFSPTDLLAASLASCMITVMGIKASQNGFTLGEVRAELEKKMTNNPRLIGLIRIQMKVKNMNYSDQQKQILQEAAENCPVALSLSEKVKQELIIAYY